MRPRRGHSATGRGGHLHDRMALCARQVGEASDRERPPEAAGVSSHAEDSERGPAPSMGKDVPAGGRPPRPRAPDPIGSDPRPPTSRRGSADPATADTQPRGRALDGGLNVARLVDGWGDLHQEAARGGEGVTGPASAENLPAPVKALVARLQQKRDRAKLMRRRYRPPGNGQARP